MTVLRPAVLLFALLLPLQTIAGIYRWVDADGRVHFGEKAPENVSSQPMDETLQRTGNFLGYPAANQPEPSQATNTQRSPASDSAPSPDTELVIDLRTTEYEIDPATLSDIHQELHAMYRAYRDWFGWPATPSQPLKIRLFGSVKTFEAYQREHGRKVQDRSYYSTSEREIVMKAALLETARTTLLHETSHAILHMQQPASSKWVNEGLAEVFSTLTADNSGDPHLKPEQEWAYTMTMMADKGQLQTAAYYLAIPSPQWKNVSKKEERQYYMLAWSLMYFLADSPEGREALAKVLERNRQGVLDGKPLVEAMDAYYPGGIAQLDQDWQGWIKAGIK